MSIKLFYTVLKLRVRACFSALIRKIKIYLAQGRYDDVAELVGEAVLDGLKKGLLISLTVKNTKGVPKPKPALPPPFKPKGPTAQKEPFDLDSIIRFVDLCDFQLITF